MSDKNIQEEIENDVRKVFNKMEKAFHEYFGKHCPVFEPECIQCKANLIFSEFKKKLWDEHVKDSNPSLCETEDVCADCGKKESEHPQGPLCKIPQDEYLKYNCKQFRKKSKSVTEDEHGN